MAVDLVSYRDDLEDMMAEALRARPELGQRRIQLVNDKISLQGSRSQLLRIAALAAASATEDKSHRLLVSLSHEIALRVFLRLAGKSACVFGNGQQ